MGYVSDFWGFVILAVATLIFPTLLKFKYVSRNPIPMLLVGLCVLLFGGSTDLKIAVFAYSVFVSVAYLLIIYVIEKKD